MAYSVIHMISKRASQLDLDSNAAAAVPFHPVKTSIGYAASSTSYEDLKEE